MAVDFSSFPLETGDDAPIIGATNDPDVAHFRELGDRIDYLSGLLGLSVPNRDRVGPLDIHFWRSDVNALIDTHQFQTSETSLIYYTRGATVEGYLKNIFEDAFADVAWRGYSAGPYTYDSINDLWRVLALLKWRCQTSLDLGSGSLWAYHYTPEYPETLCSAWPDLMAARAYIAGGITPSYSLFGNISGEERVTASPMGLLEPFTEGWHNVFLFVMGVTTPTARITGASLGIGGGVVWRDMSGQITGNATGSGMIRAGLVDAEVVFPDGCFDFPGLSIQEKGALVSSLPIVWSRSLETSVYEDVEVPLVVNYGQIGVIALESRLETFTCAKPIWPWSLTAKSTLGMRIGWVGESWYYQLFVIHWAGTNTEV